MRPLNRILAMAVAVLALHATGCRSTGRFASPYADTAPPPVIADADALAALLADRASAHPRLWAKADLAIRTEGRKGTDHVTALVLSEEGKFLRLRGSKAPVGTVFDVLIKGDEASLYFNREGMLFYGSCAELQEKLGAASSVMPEDLLSALMVQQRALEAIGRGGSGLVTSREGSQLLAWRDGLGRQHVARFRPADGLVDEWLMRDASGRELLRVKYLEYKLVDVRGREEPLPWRFEMRVPDPVTTVKADLDGYKIDPPFSSKTSEEPEADERHPLRTLEFGRR